MPNQIKLKVTKLHETTVCRFVATINFKNGGQFCPPGSNRVKLFKKNLPLNCFIHQYAFKTGHTFDINKYSYGLQLQFMKRVSRGSFLSYLPLPRIKINYTHAVAQGVVVDGSQVPRLSCVCTLNRSQHTSSALEASVWNKL